MKTRLSDLGFGLWVARCCGDKSDTARRIDVERARIDIRRALRAGWCPRYRVQREELNRRQKRAASDGVQLFYKADIFSIPVFVKKW
jgi:hypothetical protein